MLEGGGKTAERLNTEVKGKQGLESSPFWNAFMLSSDVILIHDLKGNIIQANPAAQEILGYSIEELEGMRVLDLVMAPEGKWNERTRRTEDNSEIVFKARHRRKDGTTFEAEVRTKRIEHEGQELIVGVAKDITGLQLADMLNTTLDQISGTVSSRMDFDEILRSTVSNARRALGSDSALIALKNNDTWSITYQEGFPPDIQPRDFTNLESEAARIVESTGRTLLVNDVFRDPRMNKQLATKYSIRSLLAVPLKMGGRTIGLLTFVCHAREGMFSDAHVDFANKLGRSLSLLLENARLSESERAVEEFIAGIVETVPDAIIVYDEKGCFTFANKEAERLLNLPRDEILSRCYGDPRWHLRDANGKTLQPENAPFGRLLRTKEPVVGMEFMVDRGDKESVMLSINMTPRFGPRGEFIGAIASLTDITDRKRSDDALKKRTHQLEVLTEVSNNLNSQLRTEAIARSLVVSAMDLTEAEAGVCGLYEDRQMVFREYNDKGRLIPIQFSFPKGYGVPGWVISTMRTYISNDAAHDPHVVPDVREKLRYWNLIDVPIINAEGKLLGCFEIHNKAGGRPFTKADATILEGLASSAAIALDNARIIEEKARFEAELQKQKRDYQTVFESVPAMIAIKDNQGRVVIANQVFLRTFGLTPDDVGRWSISSDAQERDRHYRDDLEVINKKRPKLDIVERTVDGKGEEIWLRTDKMPYLDSKGNVMGVIMFSLDITAQRTAREQLVQEKEYISTLMETTPSGIILVNMEGRVVFANRSAEAILGFDKNDACGRCLGSEEWNVTDYRGGSFPSEDLAYSKVVSTGKPVYGVRHAIRREDGRRIMLLMNAAPLSDEQGRMTGVIVSMEDVTDTVLAEQALQVSLKTSDDIIQQIPSGILLFQYRPPDLLNLLSVNPTANILLGSMENKVGLDFDQIWKKGAFFATKEEFLEVVTTGRSIWREGVHYSDLSVDGNFTFRAFCLPDDRLCVNFDDVTERMHEAELRRRAYSQIEENIEHFATLVDRIRNPLSAIIAVAENEGGTVSAKMMRRALEIEDILKQLDQGWLESEKVRSFLKRSL